MEEIWYYNTILLYTDNKDIIKNAKRVAAELKLNCLEADCPEDLLGIPYFVAIVDPDKISKNDLENIKEVCEDENPKEFAILFTEKCTYKIPQRIKKLIVKTPEIIDYQSLKLLILSKKSAVTRRLKNGRTYDKKLFRLFSILRKLQPEKSIIFVNDMCQEFSVSEKTIKRDIEFLKMSGEDIEFDRERKGYTLLFSMNGISRQEINL